MKCVLLAITLITNRIAVVVLGTKRINRRNVYYITNDSSNIYRKK